MDLNKPTVYPALRYDDAPAAIDFLKKAFGFEEQFVVPGEREGEIAHAQLVWGSNIVMLGSTTDGSDGRHEGKPGPSWIYCVTDDPDALYERAKAAGAEITQELTDQDYGSRDFGAKDPEGNSWHFGTYQPAPGDTYEES